jgi:catechol 2,3-dioxygenase-like lactoylglutathione lyase family enzyme
MLTGVFHFSFTVENIEESKDFYTRVLGLELVHEGRFNHPYTGRQVGYENADLLAAAFRLKGKKPEASTHILELIEYIHPKGRKVDTHTLNPGTAHMAFAVDDIFGEYKRMKSLGVRFRSEPVAIEAGPNKGGYTVYFLDCNDITLEMIQPRHTADK